MEELDGAVERAECRADSTGLQLGDAEAGEAGCGAVGVADAPAERVTLAELATAVLVVTEVAQEHAQVVRGQCAQLDVIRTIECGARLLERLQGIREGPAPAVEIAAVQHRPSVQRRVAARLRAYHRLIESFLRLDVAA